MITNDPTKISPHLKVFSLSIEGKSLCLDLGSLISSTSYVPLSKTTGIPPSQNTHKHRTHAHISSHATEKPHPVRSISSCETVPAVISLLSDSLSVYPTSHKSNLSLLGCYTGMRGFLCPSWEQYVERTPKLLLLLFSIADMRLSWITFFHSLFVSLKPTCLISVGVKQKTMTAFQ